MTNNNKFDTSDVEKPDVQSVERANHYAGLNEEDAAFMRRYDGEAGKRVVRKVSMRGPDIWSLSLLVCRIDGMLMAVVSRLIGDSSR